MSAYFKVFSHKGVVMHLVIKYVLLCIGDNKTKIDYLLHCRKKKHGDGSRWKNRSFRRWFYCPRKWKYKSQYKWELNRRKKTTKLRIAQKQVRYSLLKQPAASRLPKLKKYNIKCVFDSLGGYRHSLSGNNL